MTAAAVMMMDEAARGREIAETLLDRHGDGAAMPQEEEEAILEIDRTGQRVSFGLQVSFNVYTYFKRDG